MTFRQRAIGHMRAYWMITGIPLGLSANVYGNSLYATPHQRLGLILFFGGFVLVAFGMPTLKQFVEDEPLRRGNEKVVILGLILLFLMAGPARTMVRVVWGVAEPGDYRTAIVPLILTDFSSLG
ncbi:hypothetical protein [Streptomyces mirabilis]